MAWGSSLLFPCLYYLSYMRHRSVALVLPSLGNNSSLFLDFHHPLSDREMGNFVSLFVLMGTLLLIRDGGIIVFSPSIF